MPSTENIEFFEKNQKIINKLIIAENSKRIGSQFLPLSENDIDAAIIEMRSLPLGEIINYKFKAPLVQKPQSANTQPASTPPFGPSFKFEIYNCSNGYLMTTQGEKTSQYIFRNLKELQKIFQELFFSQKDEPKKKANTSR